jgi:hypothetical protein
MVKVFQSHNRANAIVTVILVVAIFTILIQDIIVTSASALTRYFNCVTRVANNNGTVTLQNVEGCYYKVFQGAGDADGDGNRIR